MPILSTFARSILAASWAFAGLALIAVLLNVVWIGMLVRRYIGWDGLATIAAYIIGILLVSQMTWAIVLEGEGAHQDDLSKQQARYVATSLIVNEALWTLSNTLLRLSACIYIEDAFVREKRLARFIHVIMSICAVHCCAAVLELFLICRPLSAQWDPDVTGACGNQRVSYVVIESISAVLDLAILILPWYGFGHLMMPTKAKWTAVFVFNIGAVLLVFTGLRLKSLNLATSSDFVFSQSFLGLLSAVGTMLGVLLCTSSSWPKLVHEVRYRMICHVFWQSERERGLRTEGEGDLDFSYFASSKPRQRG
ncbi:hypothetical protein EJ04DRAFT_539653 [Polyplosphaeria fusca]|uniref:Rhodopsin domain-containing protein n=1 Tax=Polyplosphaeria fusca TaxID=682080 RepID=A0A9P4RCG3_9PLEO|nr:hypothetical protein EJ04DRAFT_539653 [Polyplosphaeria fusca]